MTDTSHVLLVFGVLSALSSPAFAGPCSERIAQIERSMNGADSGPTATGTVQDNASGATAGNTSVASDTSSRLPANRPATPETTAAQLQAKTTDQAAANAPGAADRLPANRPPSPESYAAATEANRSTPSATGPQRNDATLALLSEARNLDQAGRESDCMQSVSRIK